MNQGNLWEAAAGISSRCNSSKLPTGEPFSKCLLSHLSPHSEPLARKGEEGQNPHSSILQQPLWAME